MMMNGVHLLRALAGASLLPLLAAVPASAQTQQNRTYLDLEGGLGYSSNPDLRVDAVGSGFGRISAFGYHGWGNETSNSALTAYVENTSYFRRLGNRQIFSLGATNSTQVSEKVRLFGNLGFSGDFGAQLSSRFFGAPADSVPIDPLVPPTSVIVVSPDLAALTQRQYRLNASGGAAFTLSPRDVLSVSLGGERVFFKNRTGASLDYTLVDSTVAFRRQLNERVSVGARVLANRADYSLGRSILTYGPQLTADMQLDENLQLGGAIGFVRTERDFGLVTGDRNSTDLAFDASLCRSLEYERFCGRISRRTQTAAFGSAATSSSVTGDYSRRLNARDQLQASVIYSTTDSQREIGIGRQNFYSLSGSFDRKISPRLSAGVNLAARKYTIGGPDPKADLGGSIFIRNRFGSIR